jgi:hypothetical protein
MPEEEIRPASRCVMGAWSRSNGQYLGIPRPIVAVVPRINIDDIKVVDMAGGSLNVGGFRERIEEAFNFFGIGRCVEPTVPAIRPFLFLNACDVVDPYGEDGDATTSEFKRLPDQV